MKRIPRPRKTGPGPVCHGLCDNLRGYYATRCPRYESSMWCKTCCVGVRIPPDDGRCGCCRQLLRTGPKHPTAAPGWDPAMSLDDPRFLESVLFEMNLEREADGLVPLSVSIEGAAC